MFRTLFGGFLVAGLLVTPVTASFAQAPAPAVEKYVIESPHTQILFTVNHLGFSHSTGKFLGYDGVFHLDRANPASSSVEVTIHTDSLEMGHKEWNEHLKAADYFNVAAFPAMTFKSTAVTLTGDDTADVTGDLTLLGVTKPVTLKVRHNKSGPHPFGEKYVAGFDATASIKRSDFGMSKAVPMVGDDVEIRISVEGLQEGYQGASKGKE